jgi:hypothetical protein
METLNKHFRELTRAAFAKHGFAQADVITNWGDIVGADLASVSAPERIRWPRGSGEEAQKSGGTLHIRAAPGRALELQYEASRIVGRVNSYFGYGAVAQIKVIQAAQTFPKPVARPALSSVKPVCEQELAELDEGPLKSALERLGQGIAASRTSSPQGK